MMKAEKWTPSPEVERLPTDAERIGRAHARMMDYVKNELGDEHRPRGPLEKLNPRKIYPDELAGMRFRPDLYKAEPAVIDDLEAAKAEADEARISEIRNHLRAMSWDAHGRTDDTVAATMAKKILEQSLAEAGGEPENPFTQTGFDFTNPETQAWEQVIKTLEDYECKGEAVEAPTRFVEKKIVEAWRELIRPFRQKKGERSDWPTSYPVTIDPPKLSPEVQRAHDQLVSLRHIRDQLYYQRLFPNHCMYARRARKR